MMGSLVSIVIPVYNTEKYLDRCITSVTNQTYQNLEIILVNDGSSDKCPQMCDQWAEKDSRVRVIHQENRGQGVARNTGLNNARGEYICFFDSDDYVDADLIERACTLAEVEQADTVVFGMANVFCGTVKKNRIVMPETVYKAEAIRNLLLPEMLGINLDTGIHSGMNMSACRELFSMDLLRRSNFQFVSEREIISEDYYSMLDLYAHVKKTVLLDGVYYYYCANEGSFSHSYDPDRYEKFVHFYEACLELCKIKNYPAAVKRRCRVPFINGMLLSLKQETMRTASFLAKYRRIRKVIHDSTLQSVLKESKNDNLSRNKKILFWFMRKKIVLPCYILLSIKASAE